MFNTAIAIFALVAASHGWVNTYLGCNGKFNGVMETWRGIDSYLQRVDQALCSPACPCYFNVTSPFVNNATVAPYYNSWTKTLPNQLGNVAFQECSGQVQSNVINSARAADVYFDPNKEFNTANFFDYMNSVENDFKCAGWCNVTYFNTNTNSDQVMFKYLFSNVNKGVPQRLGCLNSIIEWLPPYLNAWGAVTLVLVGFQLIVFILTLCQCWAREKDHQHQIPHHHDDERK